MARGRITTGSVQGQEGAVAKTALRRFGQGEIRESDLKKLFDSIGALPVDKLCTTQAAKEAVITFLQAQFRRGINPGQLQSVFEKLGWIVPRRVIGVAQRRHRSTPTSDVGANSEASTENATSQSAAAQGEDSNGKAENSEEVVLQEIASSSDLPAGDPGAIETSSKTEAPVANQIVDGEALVPSISMTELNASTTTDSATADPVGAGDSNKQPVDRRPAQRGRSRRRSNSEGLPDAGEGDVQLTDVPTPEEISSDSSELNGPRTVQPASAPSTKSWLKNLRPC